MGIIEDMGRFKRTASPGLNLYLWPLHNMVGIVSTRVQQLNVRTVTKTLDNVTVSLQVAVQYRIINDYIQDEKPGAESEPSGDEVVPFTPDMDRNPENHGVYRAFYRLTDIQEQLRPYVEDVVRSQVPKRSLDDAFAEKEAVAVAVKSSLQHRMSDYGYEIVNALVTDLQPDSQVMASMNAIESQRRMRMAAQEKAEADKILIVKAAEAESEAKYLSGLGVARQRKAIVDGLKESVVEFNDGVAGTSPADVMQLMMVTQYLGELSRPQLLSAILRTISL
jgi:regulator of protease activity HflC (stomatin/prohibitin superfamily)